MFERGLRNFSEIELVHRFKDGFGFLLFIAVCDEPAYDQLIFRLRSMPGVLELRTLPVSSGLKIYPAYGDELAHQIRVFK